MSFFGWLTKPQLMVTELDKLTGIAELALALLIFVVVMNWRRRS